MNNKTVDITIIVDNSTRNGMLCEHGFAALVKFQGRKILFDTGMGEAFPANVEKMGLDLDTIDAVVLSHGHYDHTGNLDMVLSQAGDIEIYAHPDVTKTRYSIRNMSHKDISMPASALAALKSRLADVRWTDGPFMLTEDCGVTGPVPRENRFEDCGGPFFLDAAGTEPDLIPDDQSIWIRTDAGLVVLAGCCHLGIINTINHVFDISGENRLHAIIGGFHLKEAGLERLAFTMGELKKLDPAHIVPCHCTGDSAAQALVDTFGDRVRPGFSGAVFRFG